MSAWQHFLLSSITEISLLCAAIYCVYRAQKNRIYPAFWQFLIFWVASDVVMLGEGFLRHLHLVSGAHFYDAYFFTYWPSFVISAFLMLRVLHEMFRHAVRSVPGVQKLGRPIFFWALTVSVILAFAAAMTPHAVGMNLFLASAQVIMRSESVMALCMLAFLALASHTMGVSFRSRIFGVVFGLGLLAVNDLVTSALFTEIKSLSGFVDLVHVFIGFAAIALWAGYFLQPEPARKLAVLPVSSPLMRWNDIAQSLGNPAGQVAVSYPPSFMTSVTHLVDSVMGPRENWPAPAKSATHQPPGPLAS